MGRGSLRVTGRLSVWTGGVLCVGRVRAEGELGTERCTHSVEEYMGGEGGGESKGERRWYCVVST